MKTLAMIELDQQMKMTHREEILPQIQKMKSLSEDCTATLQSECLVETGHPDSWN